METVTGPRILAEEDETTDTGMSVVPESFRAPKTVQERMEWFATTLSGLGEAVIVTDIDGKVVILNSVAEGLTGWRCEDAKGRPLNEVVSILGQKKGARRENLVQTVLKTGQAVGSPGHALFLARDGKEKTVTDRACPILDHDGSILGILMVLRDVSVQRKMEEELAQHQKIQALTVFAGGIAHDFNNILTAIIGHLSLARSGTRPGDGIHERLIAAEKASLRARDLTWQLSAFVKGEPTRKKVVSVVDLVTDAATFVLRGSKVRPEFYLPPDLWAIEVDGCQIGQVVSNLVINAVQAMPDGGSIKVVAENVSIGPKDSLPLDPGDYVKISFADQGHGIPEQHFNSIFEPFFTTKEKGSGLGLAIAYSAIKNHNGLITLESEQGLGATFHVYLPAATSQASMHKEEECEPARGSGRILVMEDDAMVRESIATMLRHLGYECELCTDGSEAIALYSKARTSGNTFATVLLNLTVPGGMGAETVIKELSAIDPKVKAILTSGYPGSVVMENYQQHGFAAALTKPCEVRALGKVLHKVIASGSA